MTEMKFHEELVTLHTRLTKKNLDKKVKAALEERSHQLHNYLFNLHHPESLSLREAFVKATYEPGVKAKLNVTDITLRAYRTRSIQGTIKQSTVEKVLTAAGYKKIQEERWEKS